jgi:hypothetical protein
MVFQPRNCGMNQLRSHFVYRNLDSFGLFLMFLSRRHSAI